MNAALDTTAQPEPPSVVRMQLVGANEHPVPSKLDQQITRTNYFIGNDPNKWHTDIPNYARVKYSAIYPGIDLVYYGNQRRLEHDFVVAPGADPSRIVLHMAGSTPHIDSKTGDLVLKTSAGELRLNKPVTYQTINDARREIPSNYELLSAGKVGFRVGPYNHEAQLTIDPVLVYSTYLGGSGDDFASSITVDGEGNAYVSGSTTSDDFPGYKVPGVKNKAFVSEIAADGSRLIYSTLLGGSGDSYGSGIAVDAQGNAYLTGETNSADFPVVRPYQATNKSSNSSTVFVSEIAAGGSSLVYSTYFGGSTVDGVSSIAVDAAGNAYIGGYAGSLDFPTTPGAYQTVNYMYTSSFVAEFKSGGQSLVYSTIIGGQTSTGAANDGVSGLAIDSAGNAYVAGVTDTYDFPTTPNAYQRTLTAPFDAFVTEVKAGGASLVYSTLLGGTSGSRANGIALDSVGNAYVTGFTDSTDFPLVNAYQNTCIFCGFVTKVKPGGTALGYSTFFGMQDVGFDTFGIAADASGHAYITGGTLVGGIPTVNPLPAISTGTESMLSSLNSRWTANLLYSPPILTASKDTWGASRWIQQATFMLRA